MTSDANNPDSLLACAARELEECLLIVDRDKRIVEHNAAAARRFGLDGSREDLLTVFARCNATRNPDSSSPDGADLGSPRMGAASDDLPTIAITGEDGEARIMEWCAQELPDHPGFECLVFRDITRDRAAASRMYRMLVLHHLVSRSTTSNSDSRNFRENLEHTLAMIGQAMGVSDATVYRIRNHGDAYSQSVSGQWRNPGSEQDASEAICTDLVGDRKVLDALIQRRILHHADVTKTDAPAAFRTRNTRSIVAVPIHCGERLEGGLVLRETRSRRDWTDDELAALDNLGETIARAIERIRDQREKAHETSLGHEALARAEAANRSKAEFLANMSHELRTPVTAIVGYAELAAQQDYDLDQRRSMCKRIRRSAEYLLGLINDTLDLAKIEGDRLVLAPEPTNLRDVVHEVIHSLRWVLKGKPVQLLTDISPDVPASVLVDPIRIRQILMNLASNALKFTHEGSVRIEVDALEDPGRGRSYLQFTVSDTGIGISEDKLEGLFDKFTQAHSDQRYGGTGLGLSITQHLARLMGGDIRVRSQLDVGSTFVVSIPLQEAEVPLATTEEAPPPRTDPHDLSGRTILIADDNSDNRQIFSLLLGGAGAVTRTVENGREAVDAILAGEDGFDAILLDMSMPVLDGYSAARELRSKGCELPILALTAFTGITERDRCLEAGCDDYISKPIVPDTLIRAVAEAAAHERPHAATATPPYADPIEADAATIAVQAPAGPPAGQMAAEPTRKGESLADLFRGDPEFEALMQAFYSCLPGRMAEFREALEAGDIERVGALAHKLKGGAGCYGFKGLIQAASECEQAAREGADVAAIRTLVHAIETEANKLTGGELA